MNITKVTNKQRVQFDFSPEALQRLEDLKEKVDATTKAEVIRNALKIYEWFATQIDPTSIIEVKDQEGNTIFRIPAKVLLSQKAWIIGFVSNSDIILNSARGFAHNVEYMLTPDLVVATSRLRSLP